MVDTARPQGRRAVFRSYDDAPTRVQAVASSEDVHLSTGRVRKRDFFVASSDGARSPQAYLVEFPEESTTGAHFHDANQFQVFLPSPSAWYQRTDVRQTLVHYADAFTTYGPFGTRSGAGVSFFTLRQTAASLTGYMPGARDRLLASAKKRNRHGSVPDEPPVGCEPIFAAEADGLAAFVVTGEPGTFLEVPDGSAGDGQFCLVLSGEVQSDGGPLGPKSVGWLPRDCARPQLLVDGQQQASVLVLQFASSGT